MIDSDNDGLIEAGETIRYTITITNPDDDNNATVEDVIFTDTPDPDTNLVVGSVTTSQGTVTTGNGGGDTDIAIDIGDIPDGAFVTITFDVVVKPGANEPVCNQGFISHALERPIGIGFNLPTDDPNTPEPNDPTCLPVAYCGDGIFDPTDEDCDDGNLNDNDDCSNNCTQGCGNGIVNTGEECDDGNMNNNDGCTNDCMIPAECGDGVLDPGEQCDDGNNIGGDGCSGTCTLEECGNNVLDVGEECDGTANPCLSGVCLSDCTCEDGGIIPTVSEWGLVIMALLLLSGAKVYFGRREELA